MFDYYKAQLEVVREWASYQRTTGRKLCLVLVGGNQGSYFRKVVRAIEEEGLSDDVRLFKELAHTDLPGLYQNALVNLFASSCENCPNILLEMMASGRPLQLQCTSTSSKGIWESSISRNDTTVQTEPWQKSRQRNTVKDLQEHCSKTSSTELAKNEQYDEACKTFSFDCWRWSLHEEF